MAHFPVCYRYFDCFDSFSGWYGMVVLHVVFDSSRAQRSTFNPSAPAGPQSQLKRGVEHSPGAQRARPPAGQLRGYSGRTKALRASTAPRLVHAPRMTDGRLRLHAHRQAHAHVALRKKSLHEVRYSPQTKACGRAATQGHHGRAQVGGRAPACVRKSPRAAFGV